MQFDTFKTLSRQSPTLKKMNENSSLN